MWRIETLDSKKHDRSQFECGEPEMDIWLRQYAAQSGRRGNTLTRVALREGETRVRGFYAQSAYRLTGEELKQAFGDGRRYPVPCVLLARLARCNSTKGAGLGELLLMHALRACVSVADEIGIEFVVVHALHDRARAFYQIYGFEQFADHPLHLMLSLSSVRSLF